MGTRTRIIPNHETMVSNILAVAARGSLADAISAGDWYRTAREYAETLAAGTPHSTDAICGVIAALSPQCPWAQNKRWAAECVRAFSRGEDIPNVSTTNNRVKAWRILQGESPTVVLGGPKVTAFYANLIGDKSHVTVDLWAYYVATGEKLTSNQSVPKWAYGLIAEAYRDSARRLGITPSEAQWFTWGIARGSAE